ncbi:MAG: helix-turn-helix transcriptional regulator, partial [Solirubrobacteraceae bacterium]
AAARAAAAEAIAAADATGLNWHRLEALRARGIAELLANDPQVAADSLWEVWSHTRLAGVEDPGAFPVARDLVEALVAAGRQTEATQVTETLARLAAAQDHPWGLAAAEHCRGLVHLGARADSEAITTLESAANRIGQLAMRFEHARTLIALGTAYRRCRRILDARATLELAAQTFEQLGSHAWAERARAELARVSGRRRSGELTPTQQRIAELVSQGRANKQIAAELVVTVGTVERHLTRIYAALGVRSRTELTRLLLGD